MPKTVAVVDEMGNVYQPTYVRRAKGLVKHGRTRWLEEDRICLTRPPRMNDLEKNVMKDIMAYTSLPVDGEQSVEIEEIASLQSMACSAEKEKEAKNPLEDTISLTDLLQKLDRLQNNNSHILAALKTMDGMPASDSGGPGSPGNIADQARAEAIGEMVVAREKTNQMLIRLYEKMYEDLMIRRGIRKESTTQEDA